MTSQRCFPFKIPIQQAGLDICIILVFAAGIRLVIPLDGVVVNLADLQHRGK